MLVYGAGALPQDRRVRYSIIWAIQPGAGRNRLKTVLGPWEGKLMRNLNAWHAHWGKPQSQHKKPHMEAGRVSKKAFARTALFSFDYWWNDRWDEQTHNFKWLVDKFWEINPLPGWPENWRWLSTQYDRYSIPAPETGYSPPGEENDGNY